MMNRTTRLILLALPLTFILSACGGAASEAETHAQQMCDCLQKAGLDADLDFADMNSRKWRRKMNTKEAKDYPKCALEVLKKMNRTIKNLGKKERKTYSKAFLHACVDTDCADLMLEAVPYDRLDRTIRMLEMSIQFQEALEEERDEATEEDIERILEEEGEERTEEMERLLEELEEELDNL